MTDPLRTNAVARGQAPSRAPAPPAARRPGRTEPVAGPARGPGTVRGARSGGGRRA